MRLALSLLALKLQCIFAQSELLLPLPKGQYGTNIENIELIDHDRPDPYDPDHGPRKLMTSVFYPTGPMDACDLQPVQYIPAASAKALAAYLDLYYNIGQAVNATALLTSLRVQLCSARAGHYRGSRSHGKFPVVLFSHGLQATRLYHVAEAQAVAAQGFIVITVDHPYDAAVVEYPDGSTVLATNITSIPQLDFDVGVRAQDLSFVIDQLQARHSPLKKVPALRECGHIRQVGAFGHSLGGATCARAVYDDSRIVGGLNMDGYFYGFNTTGEGTEPVFDLPNIDTPFLLFNAESHLGDEHFTEAYDSFTGWKRRLGLSNSAHATFSDLPLLVDLGGLRDKLPGIDTIVGSLSGVRGRDVITAYVGAFMKMFLNREPQPLLNGPSSAFPEVVFAG